MDKKYVSVALANETIDMLEKIGEQDIRSIPKTIEYLVLTEYKRRNLS